MVEVSIFCGFSQFFPGKTSKTSAQDPPAMHPLQLRWPEDLVLGRALLSRHLVLMGGQHPMRSQPPVISMGFHMGFFILDFILAQKCLLFVFFFFQLFGGIPPKKMDGVFVQNPRDGYFGGTPHEDSESSIRWMVANSEAPVDGWTKTSP